MATDKIHVVFASNQAYMQGLKATAVSMLRAAKDPSRLFYHVISDELSEHDKHAFVRICHAFGYAGDVDFRTQDLQYFAMRVKPCRGAHTAYARLHFPSVFEDLDWIIWTDVDILWLRDPAKLWDMRDDSVSLIWSPDFRQSQKERRTFFQSFYADYDEREYCCSGVMVMNLKRLRERGFERQCDEFIQEHETPRYHDQDILNLLCRGDTKIVDRSWDCLDPCFDLNSGIVLHFQGIGALFNKPFSHWHPAYEIWFRHYAQVIDGEANAQVASAGLRLLYWIVGLVRTPYWICKILSAVSLGKVKASNLYRPLYFCWLRRHLRW